MPTELTKEDSSGEWKVIDSEYLHNRPPWLTVRKDRLRMPGGHIIPEYYVLEYPDWVNVLGITKDGKLLLVRQYRHALGRTSFELCAGVCEPEDGTPLESARRELLEETGYGNGDWKEWMTISANPATSDNMVHCFLATGIEKIADPKPEASEDLSVHEFPLDVVKELILQDGIIQATHLAPLWKYIAMHGNEE